jgi:hypothetical protein
MESIAAAQLQLEAEIRRSTLLLHKMEEIHKELRGIGDYLYKCRIKQVPGMYRIQQTDKNTLLQKDGLKRTVQAWMELLPFTFYSFHIEANDSINRNSELNYSWGLALLEADQEKLAVCINDSVEYIQPCTCISSVIVGLGEEDIEQKAFQFMLDYAEEHRYAITGDITGKILFTERRGEEHKTYLEINVPI